MSIQAQQRSIIKAVEKYRELLDRISEEDFQRSPAEGVWSYAEVYSHIFKANLVSLIAAEQCINGTADKKSGRTHWMVQLILFFGQFPPGKYKVPESIAGFTAKISIEAARNLIVKFNRRLADISPKVGRATTYHKVKHPRLGYFNALQWYRFVDIHTRHHAKQLDRISALILQDK